MQHTEEGGASTCAPSRDDLAEARWAAAYLYPHHRVDHEMDGPDNVDLCERAEFADDLRWFAEQFGAPPMGWLADAISGSCIRDLLRWREAYIQRWTKRAGRVFGVRERDEASETAMRELTKAIRESRPQSVHELAMKIRWGAYVGVHRRVRRLPRPMAMSLYRDFDERLGAMSNHRLVCALRDDLFGPPDWDSGFIRGVIRYAGPWEAAIVDDVEHLRAEGLLR